jgi:hypothetical protein
MQLSTGEQYVLSLMDVGVRRGMSRIVEDGRRPPALLVGHPRNGCKAVLGVARPQGVEG